MRSTWYATYVCNVKSISMTVEKWSVQSVHFRVIKRETRWSRGQGRAGQTCSTMLNWARGSLRSALLHHKCAFYNPYQFLPFPQFLQGVRLSQRRDSAPSQVSAAKVSFFQPKCMVYACFVAKMSKMAFTRFGGQFQFEKSNGGQVRQFWGRSCVDVWVES